MRPPRFFIASFALLSVGVCLAGPTARVAALLPEVQRQMRDAHQCADTGSLDLAVAHADLVLLPESVSVSMKFEGIPTTEHKNCSRALDAALAMWESSLGNTIHFRREDDPTKADINVRFKTDVRMGREAVAGFTNWHRTIRTEGAKVLETTFKADVQVRAHDLESWPMSFESMRQEAEHEFGHILGLEDSDRRGDLMGVLDAAHPVRGPRDYEIDAVRSLREEARQLKADARSKQKA